MATNSGLLSETWKETKSWAVVISSIETQLTDEHTMTEIAHMLMPQINGNRRKMSLFFSAMARYTWEMQATQFSKYLDLTTDPPAWDRLPSMDAISTAERLADGTIKPIKAEENFFKFSLKKHNRTSSAMTDLARMCYITAAAPRPGALYFRQNMCNITPRPSALDEMINKHLTAYLCETKDFSDTLFASMARDVFINPHNTSFPRKWPSNSASSTMCTTCTGRGKVYSSRTPDDEDFACANCGKVSGVYGHYTNGKFDCPVKICSKCRGTGSAYKYDWRTRDVMQIAKTAYENRPTMECPVCLGEGFMSPNNIDRYNLKYPYGSPCPFCTQDPLRTKGKLTLAVLDNLDLQALADALTDAGYPEVPESSDCYPIIEHLREPGPHIRGCWALDLILEKDLVFLE